MNVFWDFSITSARPAIPATAEADPHTPAPEEKTEAAEPTLDEVVDPAHDDDDDDCESRDEEKTDSCRNRAIEQNRNTGGDLDMFSTLTELLFNPFSDGYCKVRKR